MSVIDERATMDLDTLIEQVAERVILKMRADALRVREAKLADLRAFEEMHDLPRSIPTRAERSGSPKKTGHHNRG